METLIKKEMTLTRILNAPRELVFKAWTEVDHLAQWWGPKGFTNPVCRADVRVGGKIYIEMKSPDGTVYPMDGSFTEITTPAKIVFLSSALDDQGKRIFEVMNTVLFEAENGKTILTIHAVVDETPLAKPFLDGMNEGWSQSLDRLSAHVDSMQ